MHTIDRRKLMVGGAIGATAVSLSAVPALASAGEDAELLRLWSDMLEQTTRRFPPPSTVEQIPGGAVSQFDCGST
jgi:hypothetical protein